MDILMPKFIYSTYEGYELLIELYNEINSLGQGDIQIDFQNNNWFEANLCAILGAINFDLEKEGRKISMKNLKPRLIDVFTRNKFISEYDGKGAFDAIGTTLTYRKFKVNQHKEFTDYIENELLSKEDFPKHSKLLGKKINESIFELFENARTHGNSEHVFTCGHYFRFNSKKLYITIVDMGTTIKTNVNEYLNENKTGAEAIEWAAHYGNTTKTKNISGGLGLGIISEFINLNKGKIQIISSDGFWESRSGSETTKLFQYSFPGTIANIEFNLEDKNTYRLKDEITLDDIF